MHACMMTINYQVSYSILRGLVNTLGTVSESSLLQIGGLGPAKVKRILAARASVKQEKRLFRMMDVINISRLGLGTLTEDPHAAHIAKCIAYYESEFSIGKKLQKMHYPSRVVSIDLGKVNSAYSLIDSSYQVLEWRMMDLTWPQPCSPENLYDSVEESLQDLPAADLYVMERQSSRTPSNQGILGISLHLQCLETMMYAFLRSRGKFVHSMAARQVAKYFGISAKTSALKKKNAVKLVTEMVEKQQLTPLGKRVGVSEKALEGFQSRKKKDDLSDSLLVGLAVLEWSHMCKGLDRSQDSGHMRKHDV